MNLCILTDLTEHMHREEITSFCYESMCGVIRLPSQDEKIWQNFLFLPQKPTVMIFSILCPWRNIISFMRFNGLGVMQKQNKQISSPFLMTLHVVRLIDESVFQWRFVFLTTPPVSLLKVEGGWFERQQRSNRETQSHEKPVAFGALRFPAKLFPEKRKPERKRERKKERAPKQFWSPVVKVSKVDLKFCRFTERVREFDSWARNITYISWRGCGGKGREKS